MASESQSSNIILFPKYEELKSEVEELRADLVKLYFEYDELRFVICPNIEMQYMLALGALEYKLYETQCKMLRLKRKMELIQVKLNRQEKVVISEIEEQLDEEFAEYQDLLEMQIEAMNEALDRSKGEILSDEDEKKLKTLYRKIVKALHPDLNPDLSRAEIDLFANAVEAYKNADLNAIRIIAEMLDDGELPDEIVDFYEDLAGLDLNGKIYGVVGSGDTFYDEFCKAVDDFDRVFAATGAVKGSECVKVDLSAEDEDIEKLEAFAEEVVAKVG